MIKYLAQCLLTRWLLLRYRFLGPGLTIKSDLTIAERIRLYQLARKRGVSTCMEIGSYLGASACCMAVGVEQKSPPGKILCIDTWQNDAMSEGAQDTFQRFADCTAPYAKQIIPLRGRSIDLVAQVAALTPRIDLLFIDGDHSYEGVKADWEAYHHLLAPGSFVVFHDWKWFDGVRKLVEEQVRPVTRKHGSLTNLWWGEIA